MERPFRFPPIALPSPFRALLLVAGLVINVMLAGIAVFTMVPVHRSHVDVVDVSDRYLPPDFDALRLRGQSVEGTYLVVLTVAGVVQSSGYTVGVLVQDLDRPGETYMHRLDYAFGREENYGIPVYRAGDSLAFSFPLRLLWEGSYLVGLDAAVSGPDTSDYVVEKPREALRIERLLALPIDSGVFILATAVLGIVVLADGIRASRLPRGKSPRA